jgi:GTP-binding protein
LIRETRGNVSLQVSDTETAGAFEINARGEMQIAISIFGRELASLAFGL